MSHICVLQVPHDVSPKPTPPRVPSDPQKGWGESHVPPCPCPHPRAPVHPNSPPSVQTSWQTASTQSPREGDRMAPGADLPPNLPPVPPATLAFPQVCGIKYHHSQGPGTGTAQPPPAAQQREIFFTLWCQKIRTRRYLRLPAHLSPAQQPRSLLPHVPTCLTPRQRVMDSCNGQGMSEAQGS